MDADEANRGSRRRTATGAALRGSIVRPEDVDDALAGVEAAFKRSELAGGTIAIVDGAGVSVSVFDNHLRLRDGVAWFRRERFHNRATTHLSRLVVTAGSGSLTIAALRWCHAVGISIIVLDPHEPELLLAPAAAGVDDSRLRRAQALAAGTETGLAIVVDLLRAKLDGQAALISELFRNDETAREIADLSCALGTVETVEEARQLEAIAAVAYFAAWVGRPETTMRFARSQEARVPRHWKAFTSRRSPIAAGSGNRRAATPLNAICNYLFKLGEVECHLAALAVGLDPGLGLLHADVRSRSSLADDLLEPVRPSIERLALRVIGERVFTRADFMESDDGSVRIAPPLRQDLAGTMPQWAKAVAPWAERVAHAVALASDRPIPTPTRVTGARRRAAQSSSVASGRRTRAERDAAARLARPLRTPRPRDRRTGRALPVPHRCEGCGAVLGHHQRLWCRDCWPAQRVAAGNVGARRARAQLEVPGARARKGNAISAGRAAGRDARVRALGWEPEAWETVILTGLRERNVTASQLREATGLSLTSSYRILQGRQVPDASVWPAIAQLAQAPSE
jgi:CRISPR-associated endonuclease Cas1